MKKVTTSLLKLIEKDLNEKVLESFITHISVVSSEDIIFQFSFYKKERLLISLNHNAPFLCLCDIKENIPTLNNQTSEVLRKQIDGAYIRAIHQKENDRVIEFTLNKTNDLYERETFYLVMEVIPNRSNLLLLDGDRRIIYSTHYTNFGANHPIVKGLIYEDLLAPKEFIETEEDLESFKKEALNYLEDAKERRRKDQYSHLFTAVKNRIKSLEKKIVILNESTKAAQSTLAIKDMGNLIYSCNNDMSLIQEYIDQGLITEYDETISPSENAAKIFKKYKKAKSTIEHNEIEIKKAYDEIEYNKRIYSQLENGDDTDLDELKVTLHLSKGEKVQPQRKNKKMKISPLCVNYNGTKIIFGKTDAQNNIVTFEKASPYHEFFHILNYHGSHVVILKENPSDDERLVASEIALYLSKQEDGDVQTTLVKNVKKGDSLGKVNLKSYTTFHLNEVRESTKDLVRQAKRL